MAGGLIASSLRSLQLLQILHLLFLTLAASSFQSCDRSVDFPPAAYAFLPNFERFRHSGNRLVSSSRNQITRFLVKKWKQQMSTSRHLHDMICQFQSAHSISPTSQISSHWKFLPPLWIPRSSNSRQRCRCWASASASCSRQVACCLACNDRSNTLTLTIDIDWHRLTLFRKFRWLSTNLTRYHPWRFS